MLLRGEWNKSLIDEMRMFPNGAHDDQIDSLSRGFADLLVKRETTVRPLHM
jgi:predicted phage terminase large subunit-like protein